MIFRPRLKASPTYEKRRRLRVKARIQETPNAIRLILEAPKKGAFTYLSGQFLTFIMHVGDKEVRRAYSLCSAPLEDADPAVVVKRKAKGLLSPHIHAHLKVGDTLDILPPDGRFIYDFSKTKNKYFLFFAGGSGITPIMSLLRSALAQTKASVRVYLLYANQNYEEIIFRAALEKLISVNKGRFYVQHVIEQPAPAHFANALIGRPTSDVLKKTWAKWHLKPAALAAADAFVCGPGPMMSKVIAFLKAEHMDSARIHKESFVAGETALKEALLPTEAHKVNFIMNDLSTTIEVPAGQTLLASGIEQGLDLPYSCQNGVCASCRGRLLKGRVHMKIQDALSEEEIKQGYILCCQSHPLDDLVTVQIE